MGLSYRNILITFSAILAFVVWGFYKSYFSLIPVFKSVSATQQFHAAVLLLWFALLFIQPILIRYKKYEWHKKLGRVSYVLMPLILISMFMVTKAQFLRSAAFMKAEQNIGSLALNAPSIFAFGLLYMLAMFNTKNTAYHVRYIIGNSLLLLGPGLGRGLIQYGGLSFPLAITYVMTITELLAALFLLYDIIKKNPLKPFAITLAIFLTLHLIWHFQFSVWWQYIGRKFSYFFYLS